MTPHMRLTAVVLLVTLVAVLGLQCPTYGATERAGGLGDLVDALVAAVTSMMFWWAVAGVVVLMWLLTTLFSHLLYSFSGPDNVLAVVKWATFASVICIGSLLAVMYIMLNWGWVLIALLSIPVIVLALAIWTTSER